jgi:hypothetical protein
MDPKLEEDTKKCTKERLEKSIKNVTEKSEEKELRIKKFITGMREGVEKWLIDVNEKLKQESS